VTVPVTFALVCPISDTAPVLASGGPGVVNDSTLPAFVPVALFATTR
jgi:hypothetical protein